MAEVKRMKPGNAATMGSVRTVGAVSVTFFNGFTPGAGGVQVPLKPVEGEEAPCIAVPAAE